MATKKSESIIVTSILKYLNSVPRCRAIKIHGSVFMQAGTPDIFGCIHVHHDDLHVGQMLCFEAKVPGNKPTPIQEHELKSWWECGAICAVVHSVDEVKHILEANGLL